MTRPVDCALEMVVEVRATAALAPLGYLYSLCSSGCMDMLAPSGWGRHNNSMCTVKLERDPLTLMVGPTSQCWPERHEGYLLVSPDWSSNVGPALTSDEAW